MKSTLLSSTIGIIGGADGPTAVFVASRPGIYLWLAAAIIAIAVLIIIRIKKDR